MKICLQYIFLHNAHTYFVVIIVIKQIANLLILVYNKMAEILSREEERQILVDNEQEVPKKIIEHLCHIEHNTVHISSLMWRQLQMNTYIQKIKEWKVADRLNLSNNKEPSILKGLENISFPCLKYLNLEYNLIASIEPLCLIQMPMLENLNLSGNFITNTNSLRKCCFQELKAIFLSSNRIMECKGMTEIQGKNLREIVIEKDNVNRMQCHDPRWFMKIQPFGIFESFSIKSNNRIRQPYLHKQIQKKYPYIHN